MTYEEMQERYKLPAKDLIPTSHILLDIKPEDIYTIDDHDVITYNMLEIEKLKKGTVLHNIHRGNNPNELVMIHMDIDPNERNDFNPHECEVPYEVVIQHNPQLAEKFKAKGYTVSLTINASGMFSDFGVEGRTISISAIDEKRNQISYNETTGRFSKSKYNFTNLDLYKIRGGRHNHLRLVNKMIGQVQVLHELVNSEDLLEELRKVKA